MLTKWLPTRWTWVRGTMLPYEIPTGVMRGVPLDIGSVDIAEAISSKYKNSTFKKVVQKLQHSLNCQSNFY